MKLIAVALLVLSLVACTSAIRPDYMQQATKNPSLPSLVQNPDMYRGQLFILGGLIARTTLKPEGSEIEALFVPVDSFGYPQDTPLSSQRFLALYPREMGVLDPLIYQKNRRVTIAGTFTGIMAGKVDEMEYVFPVFRIVQIYLEPRRPAAVYYYYPPPYPGPIWWGYPGGVW